MLPRFYDVVTDAAGNGIPGATVVVKTWKGDAASLFSNRDGTVGMSNTITTDARGQFAFYAAGGHYLITTTVNGYAPDTRDVALGDGRQFSPEYFGIFPNTTGEITAGLQAWHDELIGGYDHLHLPNGRISGGVIELPPMIATCDSIVLHPAVSIYGSGRAVTQITLKNGATPVNIGNNPMGQAALFYVAARAYSSQGATAWMPEFKNMRLLGASGLQGNVQAHGILFERVDNDNSGPNAPTPPFSVIGYSAGLLDNVDIYNFSGHGFWVMRGRQRSTIRGRARSTSNGIWNSTDGLVTLGSGFRIEGDQVVMTDAGAGNCTGHAVYLNAVSGSLLNGCNIWGAESGGRSNNAMALEILQSNGFSVTNNVFNDTVVIDGGSEDDRASEFSGNYMKPNDVVFLADGVPQGDADEAHNCHVLVRQCTNLNIGPNGYGSGGSNGNRYLDILHVAKGARVSATFSSSSFRDTVNSKFPCSWSSGRDVPINIYDPELGTACFYSFTDVNRGIEFNNNTQARVEGANQIYVVKTAPSNPQLTLPTDQDTYMKFSGTQDVLNIQLPYPPAAGVVYTWTTNSQINTVTLALSTQAVTDGETILASAQPGGLPAGTGFSVVYRPSLKQWWPA